MALKDFVIGMDFGVGVNGLSGAIRGDSIVRTEPQEVTSARGQTIQFSLDQIDSVEELNEALGLSFDSEAAFGLFGGSAKFDFSRQSNFHQFSLFLLARVTVINSFRQTRDEQLRQGAVDLLRAGRADRFREQFGDLFVKGIVTGGEFYAVLELTTRDSEDQRRISSELEASGFLGSFSASAQFSEQVRRATQNRSLRLLTFQRGGNVTSVPQTADEIVERAATFAEQVVEDRAVPYVVFLQDYRALDLPQETNFIDLQNASEVLQSIVLARDPLVTMINNINFILTHPDQFEEVDVDLNLVRDQLSTAVNTLTRAASQCTNNVAACRLPDFRIPQNLRLPRRRGGAESDFEEVDELVMSLSPGALFTRPQFIPDPAFSFAPRVLLDRLISEP